MTAPDLTRWTESEFLTRIRLCSSGARQVQRDHENFTITEAAAILAGEPRTDRPHCVEATLTVFAEMISDSISGTYRQQLIPLIPKMIGTAGDHHSEERIRLMRHWMWVTNLRHWVYGGVLPSVAQQQFVEEIVGCAGAAITISNDHPSRDKLSLAFMAARAAIENEVREWGGMVNQAIDVALADTDLRKDDRAMFYLGPYAQKYAALVMMRRTPVMRNVGNFVRVTPRSVSSSVRANLMAYHYNQRLSHRMVCTINNSLVHSQNTAEESMIDLLRQMVEL